MGPSDNARTRPETIKSAFERVKYGSGTGRKSGDCQGIAVAVDLQKRAAIGRSAAAAGPPGEPHPDGRIAQCDGLQPARKPQDQEGDSHPDRDALFAHINTQVAAALAEQQPVISVDAKKKELVVGVQPTGLDPWGFP
jgi:hypothetical protein